MSRSKSPAFDYEQIPAGYYDAVYQRSKGMQSKWHHLKFARVRSLLQGYTRHLDVGCGPGTFIATLGDGHISVGVDISASQIEFAQKRYGNPRRTFKCIGNDLALFPDNSFDACTLIELVEHLSPTQNEALLREAVRVLRPGGRLIVTTPNYGGLWRVVEAGLNRFGPVSYAGQHITHYTRRSFTALLNQDGLEDTAVMGYMFLAPFTACISWSLSDYIARIEPDCLTSRWGLLLLGSATKRNL